MYGLAGRRSDALRLLRQLMEVSRRRWLDPYNVATVYAGLGDADAAIEWLRRMIRERSSAAGFLPTDPMLDGLRRDPRFPPLLAEVGLD